MFLTIGTTQRELLKIHSQRQASQQFILPFRTELCLKMMDAINVLLFVLFQGMVNIIVYAAEEDSKLSRSVLFTTRQDKRLKGHVVKRFESPSLTSWCTSTNFRMPSEKNAKGTCELNKHGVIEENTKFHDQQGVTFSLLLKVIRNNPLALIAPKSF